MNNGKNHIIVKKDLDINRFFLLKKDPGFSDKEKCPKCLKSNFWTTKDKRLKCKNCCYIFTPKANPLNIPNDELIKIISEFIMEHSVNIVLKKTNVSKYKLLKILFFLRTAMSKDIPDELRQIVKISSNGLKTKEKIRRPVIGIINKEKKVYAKILPNIKTKDLKIFFDPQQKKESIEYPESWKKYNIALAQKNFIYKLNFPKNKPYQENHLDSFWKYLKNKLSSKGGIRKEKLNLYLGEYSWRYNNLELTKKEQEKKLLKLIFKN